MSSKSIHTSGAGQQMFVLAVYMLILIVLLVGVLGVAKYKHIKVPMDRSVAQFATIDTNTRVITATVIYQVFPTSQRPAHCEILEFIEVPFSISISCESHEESME